MPDNTYSKLKEKLILRDYLAIDRTILANERTFLAYVRTALTLFVAGVSLVQFFNITLIQVIGWSLIPLGAITLIIGLTKNRKMKNKIKTY